MFIKLSEYYYTNKFIPISTDSTVLKIVKVSGLIFLGPIAFLFDYGLKLLAHRNITKEKGPSDLFPFVRETLNNTGKPQDTLPVIEQASIEMNLAVVGLSSLVESIGSRLASAETPYLLPVSEQVSTEMPANKYSINLTAQKKTLEEYVQNNFQVTPEDFLRNLQLFVVGKSIDFKFVPIFGKGPFSIYKHLVKVMEVILNPNNELCNDYEEYTKALRAIISIKEYESNKHEKLFCLIQELCFAKFIYTVLTDLEKEILKNTIGFDSSRNMTSSNISRLIKEDNKILRKQRKTVRKSILLNCEKVCNAAGINSDQLCSANIPELRSIHKVSQGAESYDIYYIRYPTPTIETKQSCWVRFKGDNATAIASEFIGFLDCIQRKKIPFLHVNHQYMDKKNNDSLLSADNNRAEAIQRLEETHAEVFHFLSLPFDGPIIDKIDKGSLIEWKRNLVNNLIREKAGFRVPKKFRESAVSKQQEIEQLLNELHKHYFSEKPELNKIERRVLLVIFYSYLKEYFKAEYQIRVMASVCKDNKDRGNVSACIDEALFNLRLGKENDQKALKELHLRILSPFIFRNEGIVEHRLKFLTDLLDHIAKLDDAQKEKICAFKVNEQYQIVDQRIPRSNDDIMI